MTDAQRRRLAIKGKLLGRRLLGEIATIVTPDTILRWHHRLVAMKWDHSQGRRQPGRPTTSPEIVALALRFARENRNWGYDRIRVALANLGHDISDTTVGNILEEHEIESALERKRKTSWREFIKVHWDVLGAVDVTTVEVWTKGGLVTLYLLFVMQLRTRRVCLAGVTPSPDTAWMKEVPRSLTGCDDGFLIGNQYVLMDRDGKFCDQFCGILEQAGVKCVRLPPKSPNLNAFIERLMRSPQSGCLDRMILFETSRSGTPFANSSSTSTERGIARGLENRLIEPDFRVGRIDGTVKCRERIGGLLRHYYRDAA